MSCAADWTNVFAQLFIAGGKTVAAGATVYTTYITIWKRRRHLQCNNNAMLDNKSELDQVNDSIVVPSTVIQKENDNVERLIKMTRSANDERSKPFDDTAVQMDIALYQVLMRSLGPFFYC